MTGPERPKFPSDAVAELEEFIADAEARGEPVPPEARLMLDRLRELMVALQALTASFGERAERSADERAERSADDEDLH